MAETFMRTQPRPMSGAFANGLGETQLSWPNFVKALLMKPSFVSCPRAIAMPRTTARKHSSANVITDGSCKIVSAQ